MNAVSESYQTEFKTDRTSSQLSANPSRDEKRRPCTTERKRISCVKYNYSWFAGNG